MGLDEDYAVATLNSYLDSIKEIVRQYRGSVFGSAGDSLMVQFVSPTDAVSCAIEVQDQLRARNANVPSDRKVEFRIGIDLGRVIEERNALHGDTVNVAVRLQEAAPSCGILVSSVVSNRVRGSLDCRFRPLGEFQFKNILHSVSAFEVCDNSERPQDKRNVCFDPEFAQAVPSFDGRPALAVLPFDGETHDLSNAYLSDGFSDDLISNLSHLRWLPIINRGTSFEFRGSHQDARKLGKELGVRYLLEGSLRVIDERLRVTARLVDTETARSIWSEHYDASRSGVLEVLDEIAWQIVGALQGQIAHSEQVRARARRASRLNTWDVVWRGRWHMNRFTQADAVVAHRLFAEALEMDSESAEVKIHMAMWAWYDAWSMRRSEKRLLEFKDLAKQAVKADPDDSRCHLLVGAASMYLRELDDALVHLTEALRLNPSSASAYHHMGSTQLLRGFPDKAMKSLLTALKLSPRDADEYTVLGDIAASYYIRGEWDKAIEFSNRSIALRLGYWYPRVIKIGAYARSERLSAAAKELEALYTYRPRFSKSYIDWLPYADQESLDYFHEGLELAAQCEPALSVSIP